ncbi:hypothetical protein OIDMADRAFT_55428 [Oidiodendron maius Zn]|uniref:Uncharacterized protein n=1 Tax=Oidiodendron maius (strain Zn) TaxID=913774 RepID=A0A0C3DC37_OIDMZ|nr:hypothetical protein OIDMADRAFT_55428 [Oidiodendron maius Zn]
MLQKPTWDGPNPSPSQSRLRGKSRELAVIPAVVEITARLGNFEGHNRRIGDLANHGKTIPAASQSPMAAITRRAEGSIRTFKPAFRKEVIRPERQYPRQSLTTDLPGELLDGAAAVDHLGSHCHLRISVANCLLKNSPLISSSVPIDGNGNVREI